MINFICKTNYDDVFINYAVFDYKGKEVIVDRDITRWDYDSNSKTIDMGWYNCFIWDEDKTNDIPNDFDEAASFIKFNIEDDINVPDDYYCELISCSID